MTALVIRSSAIIRISKAGPPTIKALPACEETLSCSRGGVFIASESGCLLPQPPLSPPMAEGISGSADTCLSVRRTVRSFQKAVNVVIHIEGVGDNRSLKQRPSRHATVVARVIARGVFGDTPPRCGNVISTTESSHSTA